MYLKIVSQETHPNGSRVEKISAGGELYQIDYNGPKEAVVLKCITQGKPERPLGAVDNMAWAHYHVVKDALLQCEDEPRAMTVTIERPDDPTRSEYLTLDVDEIRPFVDRFADLYRGPEKDHVKPGHGDWTQLCAALDRMTMDAEVPPAEFDPARHVVVAVYAGDGGPCVGRVHMKPANLPPGTLAPLRGSNHSGLMTLGSFIRGAVSRLDGSTRGIDD